MAYRFLFGVAGFVLFLAACHGPTTGPAQQAAASSPILPADSLLHVRTQAIFAADAAYAQLAGQRAAATQLDSSNAQITQAEVALIGALDSLRQLQSKIDDAQLQQWLNYFQAFVQSRRDLANLRMVLSASRDDSASLKGTVAQLQQQLREKNEQLAAQKQSQTAGPESITTEATIPNAPAKGETAADLKQRNGNLYKAYSDLQVKYFNLGRNYLVLQKEHERTVNELEALRKSNGQ